MGYNDDRVTIQYKTTCSTFFEPNCAQTVPSQLLLQLLDIQMIEIRFFHMFWSKAGRRYIP